MNLRILALCLLTGSCATTTPSDTPPSETALPLPTRLSAVTVTNGGQRPLLQLDVTGDQRLDANDVAALEHFVAQVSKYVEQAGEDVSIADGLYPGPKKDAPSVFSLVQVTPDGIDLSQVPRDRLEELAVESKWLAAQARIADPFVDELTPGDPQLFGGMFATRLPGYAVDQITPAALCEGLRTFDLTPYQQAGLELAAVFDLDSTVWDGNITDAFLAVLAERNIPKPERNPRLQAFLKTLAGVDPAVIDANTVGQNAQIMLERATNYDLPKDQRVSAKDAFYNIVALLEGLTEAEVAEAARIAYHEGTEVFPPWKERIFFDTQCTMADAVEILLRRGVKPYLLSATLDVLAEEGGRVLGVPEELVLGSVLVRKGGVYTGEVGDSTYYTKGAIVRQWLPAPPLMAFGDSPTSDFPMMLEAWGPAFMINPREKFQVRDDQEAGSRLVAVWFPATVGTAPANSAPQVEGSP